MKAKTQSAIRKVVKFGNGCLAVSLAKDDCKYMGIKHGDKVFIQFKKVDD